jgi:hypothetical protein
MSLGSRPAVLTSSNKLLQIWYLNITFKNYRPGLLPNIYREALLSASPQAIIT